MGPGPWCYQALRLIIRYFSEAVHDVTLDMPKGLPLKERKKQKCLKRRLWRKRSQPLLLLFLKAFSPGYEPVAGIYIEGTLAMLQDERAIIQTESVQRLQGKLRKFFNKHGEKTLLFQLEQRYFGKLPSASNALESKHSIFKPFSRIAKSFQRPDTCENFFNMLQSAPTNRPSDHQTTHYISPSFTSSN